MSQSKPTPLFRMDSNESAGEEDPSLPVSQRIRSRLERANLRYNANDNISAFLKDGEMQALEDEVEEKLADVLRSLVINTEAVSVWPAESVIV